MEASSTHLRLHSSSQLTSMNPFLSKLRHPLALASSRFKLFCTSLPNRSPSCRKSVSRVSKGVKPKVSDSQMKENWLASISCPFPEKFLLDCDAKSDVRPGNAGSDWVIGVDPDVSGALALLKNDGAGCSAQVFDSPQLKVLVSGRHRRRLDAKSIVLLLQSLNVPLGTTAYIEQSIPYPQDGKQGWWGGGFGYGLWIGILVASGFSVVPIPSLLWKNEFKLSGSCSSKDDSRELASTLFPSMSSLVRRKKDHGRAEALLIAAYGKGMKICPDPSESLEESILK